uniref:Uncharacterized protein n=1 Tax=Talaromyces marneffei PM1 TaxID=1077442 RepID=A0A093UYM7_TALMA
MENKRTFDNLLIFFLIALALLCQSVAGIPHIDYDSEDAPDLLTRGIEQTVLETGKSEFYFL